MKRVPTQRFDAELLDAPITDLDLLADNFGDMAAVNRYLGGHAAVQQRVARWLDRIPSTTVPTILDVATGAADGPQALVRWARRRRPVQVLASDIDRNIVTVARRRLGVDPVALLQHDALQLPFADHAVDIITCTLALHHFAPAVAIQLLRELARVARYGVVVNDLRRSWGGYWGARLLALGPFHELSKHDGPLSVLRAYTQPEAQMLLQRAGVGGTAYAEPVFRLSLVIEHPATRSEQPYAA